MVMNVLWSRLIDTTGKDWRHAYKALTVIEYLVANGSERAMTHHMLGALKTLGLRVEEDKSKKQAIVEGCGGNSRSDPGCGGNSMRPLTAAVTAAGGNSRKEVR